MPTPKPLMNLDGHCSVIYNNTLYTFGPDGFASIPLHHNGTWERLPPGEQVAGAACVTGGVDGNEHEQALYVIGGSGARPKYSGIQRFLFKDRKWEPLTSNSNGMVNRTHHGAGYVKSISSILVYAGDQQGSTWPSAATLLLSTKPPYGITSLPAQAAPPSYDPMILPWSASEVALVGGSAGTAVYVFDGQNPQGWKATKITLPSPIPAGVQCALVSEDDGSKVLESFKMDVSPNTVSSLALLQAGGKPASPAIPVGTASHKRSLNDFPSYNGTFAPTTTQSDYSLAQGNGLVVISSGHSNNSLAVFNQTSNGWLNATELFYGNGEQNPLKATATTTTSLPTSTASPSSTPTTTPPSPPVPAAGGSSSGNNTNIIIGAALGGAAGLVLILLLILFLLRRAKQKKQPGKRDAGADGRDRFSFQDQGVEPLAQGAYPMAKSPVPVTTNSADSVMRSGKAGENSLRPPDGAVGYNLSPTPSKNSPLSTIPSSGLRVSSVYSTEGNASSDAPAADRGYQPGNRTTDEGWSKYFQGNSATNLGGTQSDRSTVSSDYTKSDYRGSALPMTNLAPVEFGLFEKPKPIGRVFSGSPTTSTDHLPLPESQSARISSGDSISSDEDDEEADGSNWDGAGQKSWLGRPTSSMYSISFYNSSTRDLPATASQPQPADNPPGQSHGRKSSVVVPDDIDEFPARKSNVNSDMSWLNLKAGR